MEHVLQPAQGRLVAKHQLAPAPAGRSRLRGRARRRSARLWPRPCQTGGAANGRCRRWRSPRAELAQVGQRGRLARADATGDAEARDVASFHRDSREAFGVPSRDAVPPGPSPLGFLGRLVGGGVSSASAGASSARRPLPPRQALFRLGSASSGARPPRAQPRPRREHVVAQAQRGRALELDGLVVAVSSAAAPPLQPPRLLRPRLRPLPPLRPQPRPLHASATSAPSASASSASSASSALGVGGTYGRSGLTSPSPSTRLMLRLRRRRSESISMILTLTC